MTLLQAMERTDWSLRVTSVVFDEWRLDKSASICEVCGNERYPVYFVVVADEYDDITLVVVGPICARDIRKGLPKQ